ncbi:toast rack family protein [uncultured Methanoregula sp.]|uniref:toast rack family protein n=1 Tax=uncultured Methanoregula sp. TaxID=1005933 RepID=UPI002AAB9E25|nr:toast rack family protein [uncultured Methanoregula sp.]
MNPEKTGTAHLTHGQRFLVWSKINPVRLVMWLVAITIISFVIGFGILALSGEFPPATGHDFSPFRNTALMSPNITTILLDGARQGEVHFSLGAGKLALQGGAPPDALMEVTVFSKAREWQPDLFRNMNTSKLCVAITEKGHKAREWFAVDSPNHWEIRLNDDLPLDLDIHVGAGDSRLDLGTLNLSTLTINNGAGNTRIDLGGYHGGRFDAEISNGIGDLTVFIPKYSNTRIDVDTGVGDVTGSGLIRDNGMFTTVGYNPAIPVNTIRIKQGIGSISLEAV